MKAIKLKLSAKIAILAFVLSLFGIASLAVISYQQSEKIFKNNLVDSTGFEVEKITLNVHKKIYEAKKDILFASNSEPIFGILRTTRNKYNFDEDENMHISSWKDRLEKLFIIIMNQNSSYFQMRLIGVKDDGKEIIRVDRIKKDIIKIQKKELQSKSGSGYFIDTAKLKNGEIYISKINLNKEHHVIVTPFIPTVRIATPIYNGEKLFGIVIINIDINKLLEFKNFESNKNINMFVANEDGYYLYHKNKDKTFGFEFAKEYLIQKDYNINDYIVSKSNKNHSFYEDALSSAISIEKVDFSKNRFIYIMQVANSAYFKNKSQNYISILGTFILVIAIIIAIIIAFLIRYLTAPISKLTDVARQITQGKEVNYKSLEIKSGDEIEELAISFKYMLNSLSESRNTLENFAKNLEVDVEHKTKELRELNEALELKVQNAVEESRKKDILLQQQSKMASMGEMIGAIAHQWRQPLNAVSLSIQNLKYDYMAGDIDEEFLDAYIEENKKIIKFMSETIDDFRSFFRVDKQKKKFNVKETIESVVSMQSAQLNTHNIALSIDGNEFEYFGLKSEFQQVILNIINNAKDVLDEKEIQNPSIKITIDSSTQQVSIEDNANGVPQDIIDRIFEPYFTTKEQGKGTGMGLYMSKMIIEDNMDSLLDVENTNDGAKFIIRLKENKNSNV